MSLCAGRKLVDSVLFGVVLKWAGELKLLVDLTLLRL